MSYHTTISIICSLFVLVLFSAFFSGAETAYSSVSASKLEMNSKKGKKSAKLIKKHYKSFGWTLATILICNNIVNILASSIATYFTTQIIGVNSSTAFISTAIITPIIVIFGEILPKLLAKKYAYGYLTKIAYVMEILNIILFPITYPLSKIALESKITNSEVELKGLINIAKKEGVIDNNEATLTSRALDLDSRKIKDIMTKKEEIISVNINSNVNEALIIFKNTGHSRILVEDKNKYVGVVILKDLFLQNKNNLIKKYIMPVSFISQYKLATKALEEMRKNKKHIVIISQKQDSNNVVGILTLEDIIEELVGEIYDEHDEELSIQEIAHFKWKAIGTTTIKDVEEAIKIKLNNEDHAETLKQWLQSRINRRIKKKLAYNYKNKFKFKILSNKNKEETIIEITKK